MIRDRELRELYRDRLKELITRGEQLQPVIKTYVTQNWAMERATVHTRKSVECGPFVEWKTNCTTLLEQLVPQESLHRRFVDSLPRLPNTPLEVKRVLAFLRSLGEDLERGLLLDGLSTRIAAAISADYLDAAEDLLNRPDGSVRSAVAVTIAGVTLERHLRTMCAAEDPSSNAAASGLNALAEELKRRGVINEAMAKQLRAWADLRNHAAHGRTGEFAQDQAEAMVAGVKAFLARYS